MGKASTQKIKLAQKDQNVLAEFRRSLRGEDQLVFDNLIGSVKKNLETTEMPTNFL